MKEMTPQEAINKLNDLKLYYNDEDEESYYYNVGFDDEDNEALDMAIKALEKQNVDKSAMMYETMGCGACEDCVSRQAVLDKKELVELEDGQSFYCINPKDIETLPSVIPQPKSGEWILTSKKLPPIFTGVLVTRQLGSGVSVEWGYTDSRKRWANERGYIAGDVIAWMPLPQPYKEENADGNSN